MEGKGLKLTIDERAALLLAMENCIHKHLYTLEKEIKDKDKKAKLVRIKAFKDTKTALAIMERELNDKFEEKVKQRVNEIIEDVEKVTYENALSLAVTKYSFEEMANAKATFIASQKNVAQMEGGC